MDSALFNDFLGKKLPNGNIIFWKPEISKKNLLKVIFLGGKVLSHLCLLVTI
jgi:hypothetical protein